MFFDLLLTFHMLFSLIVELGASPVTALLVPLDAVTRAHADPPWNRLVLLDLLGVLHLNGEGLEATHIFFSRLEIFWQTSNWQKTCFDSRGV